MKGEEDKELERKLSSEWRMDEVGELMKQRNELGFDVQGFESS